MYVEACWGIAMWCIENGKYTMLVENNPFQPIGVYQHLFVVVLITVL